MSEQHKSLMTNNYSEVASHHITFGRDRLVFAHSLAVAKFRASNTSERELLESKALYEMCKLDHKVMKLQSQLNRAEDLVAAYRDIRNG